MSVLFFATVSAAAYLGHCRVLQQWQRGTLGAKRGYSDPELR